MSGWCPKIIGYGYLGPAYLNLPAGLIYMLGKRHDAGRDRWDHLLDAHVAISD